MTKLRQSRPVMGIILSILFIAFCCSPQVRAILNLPQQQKMVVGETNIIPIKLPALLEERLVLEIFNPSRSVFATPEDPAVVLCKNGSAYEITALKPGKASLKIKLLGYIPVKSIAIESVPPRRVVVGGHSIGVLLQSRGIMVVGFAPIVDRQGEKLYPAREQGVEIGDLIIKVNNQEVKTETDLAKIIDTGKDSALVLNIKRKEKLLDLTIRPVFCSETQRYRVGLFVRDGVVGVGTLTFWDPGTRQYAALGHIIMDADTKQGIDVLKGRIVSASIQTIKPGKPGRPGEKIGVFQGESNLQGSIAKNTAAGIFGVTAGEVENNKCIHNIEIGYAHQVHTGKAHIYTVVNGTDIEQFEVNIEKVYPERRNGKGMVVQITDTRLLSITGGIVQGMSGSPIVQEGRLIGAITHVFLNDPQRGYGIFMDNILSEMPSQGTNVSTISTTICLPHMAACTEKHYLIPF
ncbi:MAG: SpoIVB peptidase [Syntrophomonadaceae bacterium]